MAKPHLNCLEETEALALMLIPKTSSEILQWKASNNKNFLISQFSPLDARDDFGGTLAGTVINLEYKAPKRIKSSEKLLLTLHKVEKGTKYRAYQIEAADESKKSSHNANGDVFGCHEHIGPIVNKLPPRHPIHDLSSWFGIFCGKVHLVFNGKLPEL